MKYKFYYNLKSEIQIAKKVISDLKWYNENGYEVFLPEGVDKLDDALSLSAIVKKEFIANKDKIKLIKNKLNKLVNKNNEVLDEFFLNFDYTLPDTIKVYLTNYGSGGSYYLPNEIVILVRRDTLDLLETMIHEVVHLIIEKPFILKNNITHWQKEILVNILCGSRLLEKISKNNTIQKRSEKLSGDLIEKLKFKNKKSLNF